MNIEEVRISLLEINDSFAKALTDQLHTIYNEELPKRAASGGYSDLGAFLKSEEKKLLIPLFGKLPKMCEQKVIKGLLENGLPQSQTMPVWDSISRKIGVPQFKELDDTKIRASITPQKTSDMKLGNIHYAVPIILGGICIGLVIFAPTPVKVVAGGVGVLCAGHTLYKCIISRKKKPAASKAFNLDVFLNKQRDINSHALNAYVKSVTDAALAAMRERI